MSAHYAPRIRNVKRVSVLFEVASSAPPCERQEQPLECLGLDWLAPIADGEHETGLVPSADPDGTLRITVESCPANQ